MNPGIAVQGSYAYNGKVWVDHPGCVIPLHQLQWEEHRLYQAFLNVAVSGDYAYVADGDGGLRVVTSPTRLTRSVGFGMMVGMLSCCCIRELCLCVSFWPAGGGCLEPS
jgi:hypothetical protein